MILLDVFFVSAVRMSRACRLELTCFLFLSLSIQLKLAFTLDHETGLPQGCHIYEYQDSNK